MTTIRSHALLAAAGMSALASLLHVMCILVGAPAYRLLGAGEEMARMAAAGYWFPTVVTSAIAAVLLLWSLYALSGAGVIRRLPLLRLALIAITGVYLLRGLAFPALMAQFPGNSMSFWYLSSAICLVFGVVHAVGLRQVWPQLCASRA